MSYTTDDIVKLYNIKCGKYKAEQLTDELKKVLLREAYEELLTMDSINRSSVC